MKERINWIDWAKALAVCSVVFCHLPQSQKWFYYRYLQALTMVIFIFISGYPNKQTSKLECGKTAPIVTVHNGIDIRRFADAKPIIRSVKGMEKNDFVVFYSGRLTKEKGSLELIQAFKQINTIPNLNLIIVGTLKTANVVVVLSLWEKPFGLTVLEAMVAGIPLIATRCGGIPDICKDVAILAEKENIQNNITNAISHLYQNPEKARLMRHKALERSLDFNKDFFSNKYLNTILKMLSNNQEI